MTFLDSFRIAWMKFGSLNSFFDNDKASLDGEISEISKYLFSDLETIFWATAITSPSLISTDSLLIALIIISAKLSPGSIRGSESNAISFIDLIMLPI